MAHSDRHPEYREGCFGCKVASIGYDGKNYTKTFREDLYAPGSGSPDGGKVDVREHRSGRVDVTVRPKTVHTTLKVS